LQIFSDSPLIIDLSTIYILLLLDIQQPTDNSIRQENERERTPHSALIRYSVFSLH